MAESLLDKANIAFKSSLEEDEIRELFVYLARALDSRIDYHINRKESVGDTFSENKHFYSRLHGIEIGGTITPGKEYRDKGCILAPFNCFKNMGNYTTINGIRFDTAPDYEIEDVSDGEVKLMDDTRKYVNEFINILEDRL